MKNKLRLRKLQEKDQAMIKEWRMMPEVTKYMYTDPIITDESQKIWFRSIEYDDSVKYWVIVYDDVDIGLLNISGIDYVNKRCDWAYYIADTRFKGIGLGRGLECNIYDYTFDVLKLNKLCCEVMTTNEKVVKIHQHFGSKIEGLRKAHIWKNGNSYDIVEMAILKDEWSSIRSGIEFERIEIED